MRRYPTGALCVARHVFYKGQRLSPANELVIADPAIGIDWKVTALSLAGRPGSLAPNIKNPPSYGKTSVKRIVVTGTTGQVGGALSPPVAAR